MSKILAVDFDGTLVKTEYPRIGPQRLIHKLITAYVVYLYQKGWKIALWTLRENRPNKPGDYLKEAVEWCHNHGFIPEIVNENSAEMTAEWGHSRKLAYDLLIDDKSFGLLGWLLRMADR